MVAKKKQAPQLTPDQMTLLSAIVSNMALVEEAMKQTQTLLEQFYGVRVVLTDDSPLGELPLDKLNG